MVTEQVKFKCYLGLIIGLFILEQSIYCADLTIAIQAEKTTIAPLETISVEVVVKGDRNASPPELKHSNDLKINYISYSSAVQIINGEQSSSTSFIYELSADKEGEYQLGPAILDISGRKISSESKKIIVQKRSASAKAEEEEFFFVRATVNKERPFVHEQITYTFRFYNRARIANAEYQAPNFDGFWKEELGKQREFRETYNGQDFEVTELQMALFANETKTLRIGHATLQLSAIYSSRGRGGIFDDSFFGFQNTKRISLQSDEIEIPVQPLPPPPHGQQTALVGKFTLNASLSKQQAKEGDSLTLTLILSGTGNIWDSPPPDLNLKDMRIYADKPNLILNRNNRVISGKKEFKYALVPISSGTLTIPEISFAYFDPQTKEYRVAQSTPLTLQVEENKQEENKHERFGEKESEKKEVKILGSDLMPAWTEVLDLDSDETRPFDCIAFFVLLVLSPSLYVSLFLWKKRREIWQNDYSYLRRKKAFTEFKKSSKNLANNNQAMSQIGPILRQYLSDRLNIEASAITSGEVERLLQATKLSKDVREQVRNILNTCEQALYSGGQIQTSTAQQIELLNQIVQRIEKEC